jgi:hypothetical protein
LATLGANANTGSLTLRNGATFAAISPFANAGQFTVEAGSTATVTANYAATVIGFSSEYDTRSYAAAQALGPPNTTSYGVNTTAWMANFANAGTQSITLGFNAPVFATGAVLREDSGNGFVTQIDALDTDNVFHTVWIGTDPSPANVVYDFNPTWSQTPYLVKGLKITTDTNHTTGYEQLDAVTLLGTGPVIGYTQSAGTTTVNGTLTVSAANLTGGNLAGTGTINGPVTAAGAAVDPGRPPGTAPGLPGRLTVNGNFAMPAGGSFVAEITGTTAATQYDQLKVNGTVTLGGGLAGTVSYPSVVGDAYTLIDNDGTDPVVGTFANLPEGAVVALSGLPYRVSYTGGTGNDVVVTRLPHAGVASVAVNGGAQQRSRVTDVTVAFNTVVALPANAAQAFQITRTGPGTPGGTVGLTVDLSGSTATQTVARLTFSGALTDHGSLVDGTYLLTVFGSQFTGPGGLALDGDNDGVAGGDFLYGTNQSLEKLYRLFGDADGNRVVNQSDLALFRAAYGGGDPTFDVDGNGVININDLVAFRANYGMGV